MRQNRDRSVTLTEGEWASVCMLAVMGAHMANEDVPGALLKYGAFRLIHRAELCVFSSEIEAGNDRYDEMITEKLKRLGEETRRKFQELANKANP